MVEPNWEMLGKRLDAVQKDLREMKVAADVDRRNRQGEYAALVQELGAALGTFETRIDHRLDQLSEQLSAIEALIRSI
jgi:hypothetical protein